MTTTKQKGRNSGKSATPTTSNDHTAMVGAIALVQAKDEPRIDSRLLAQHLGNKHKSVRELIQQHRGHFERFSQLRFQTEVGERQQGGGNPERYALLTEDQAYFLLSLSRNTERVVDLKARLVLAFREARQSQELTRTDYLPTYHALHDEIRALAAGSVNERFIHMNVNKLVNKAAGIESGQRPRLDVPHKSLTIAAQFIATQAMRGAANAQEAYAAAKDALAGWGTALGVSESKAALAGGGHAA